MAREFQRGHKAKLSDLTAGTDLYVGVRIDAPGVTFDISCFGLDADERLSDDRYFIFYNQPKSPEESIQQLGEQAGDTESFRVTLDRIPDAVRHLSFSATIDGAGQMSQVATGYIRVVAGGEEVVRYPFTGAEFSTERAVMLGDIYFKNAWRFAAVGQGFDGGLAALLANFGGEVLEDEDEGEAQPEPSEPAGTPAPAFAPPSGPPPAFAPPSQPNAPQAPAQPSSPQPPPAPSPQPSYGSGSVPQHAAPTMAAPLVLPGQGGQPPATPGPPQPPPAAPQPYAPHNAPGYQAAPTAPHAPGYPGATQPGTQYPAPQPPGYQQPGLAPQMAPVAPPGAQQPPGPPGGQSGYGVPQGTGSGLSVTLEKYREAPDGQRWTLQNAQLARVDLGVDPQPVLAKQGSMVLYQGKAEFSYKGAGIRGRIVGNATGQEMQLMRCSGSGQVFFAEEAAYLHPIELQGDAICVSAENVLAFDESLAYEVRRIEGHGIPGGALFTMQFHGTGTVVVKTKGTPVVLPVTQATYADAQAVIAWSAAAQVIVTSQVRLRRQAYPGHSGEGVNLQFRGAPGNFIVVQPYEV